MSLAAYGFPQWHRPANLARIVPLPELFLAVDPAAEPLLASPAPRPFVERAGAGTGMSAVPCAVPAACWETATSLAAGRPRR